MREYLEKWGEEVMGAIHTNKPKVAIEMKLVLVTPKLAKDTLEFNTNNRILSPVRVDEFVWLIKNGLFQTTHQGIALDEDGILLDGQHRLAAIVKSNCSVYMWVAKGLTKEALLAIDTGKSRNPLAIAKMIGRHTDTVKHYAIARILKFGVVKSTQMHIPETRLFSITDAFSECIDFALSCGGKGINTVILAVVARAFYTQDKTKLSRFLKVYKTGVSNGENERSAIKLRDAVTEKKFSMYEYTAGREKINTRLRLYRATESALIDFINEYPTKIIQESKKEKFPLPVEADGWNGN
jgi:hypothetical protein